MRGGAAPTPLSRLGKRLTGFAPSIAFVVWLGLMLVIPGLVLPGMTQVFVDSILVERFDNWLGPLLIGLGATFVMQFLLSSIQELALLRIELRLALEQSALFTWHVLRLPMEFFNQRFTGDLVNRVDANDRIATLVARDIGGIAASCITALFLGVVMVFYDATLAAIAIGGAADQHRRAPPRPSRHVGRSAPPRDRARPGVRGVGGRPAVDRDAEGHRHRA